MHTFLYTLICFIWFNFHLRLCASVLLSLCRACRLHPRLIPLRPPAEPSFSSLTANISFRDAALQFDGGLLFQLSCRMTTFCSFDVGASFFFLQRSVLHLLSGTSSKLDLMSLTGEKLQFNWCDCWFFLNQEDIWSQWQEKNKEQKIGSVLCQT